MRNRRRQAPTKADHHNAIRQQITHRFGPDISEKEINGLMDEAAERYARGEDADGYAIQLYRALDQLMISHRENQGHKSMLDNVEHRMLKDKHQAMGWG